MNFVKSFLSIIIFFLIGNTFAVHPWQPDLGDGSYKNPIIHADYSDPDVVRVEDNFYMVASSFNCVPGMPVLHSKDLVNWKIIGHVYDKLPPVEYYDTTQHGSGCWAPAIRYHNGEFYVCFGNPDFGIYMSKTKNPAGPWESLHLVREAKGWIDPCPFWDDNGKAYLVHAFAGSRSGRKTILVINQMSPDGKSLLDDGVLVFDGHENNHRVIEGPKMYKRNGYYYIFAPSGGVKPGVQVVLRSKNVYGPYEDKVVLHQGNTEINGPHQGGWVELESGESWFVHFQDKGAYGRVVHLNPVRWVDDWPLMGLDINKDGIGEPVSTFKKPNVGKSYPIQMPQTSDEFDSPFLGLQWQWHANPEAEYMFISGAEGFMRMYCQLNPESYKNIWDLPNLLLQKLPAPEFTVTTKLKFKSMLNGDKTGLLVMGIDYAYVGLVQIEDQLYLLQSTCMDSRGGADEILNEKFPIKGNECFLRMKMTEGSVCQFSYSLYGKIFKNIGKSFTAREGQWIGAKVGLFAQGIERTNDTGYADYDWFRIEK